MKIIRNILTTAFTLMLVVSCTEKSEEDIFKIYPIKDPQNVRLSDHTENSLTISWDEIEEAIFYQVQLFDADDSESPIADFRINDESSYTFSELNKDGLYNARVRVFVEKTKSSEWVYMMTDDGRWATLSPIIGMVDNIKIVENALKLLNSTSSTLTVSWTFNQQSELSNKYTIEIFRDKACTDLELSWNDIGGTDLFPEYLRYTFSGLEPNKSYFIKVTDLTNDLVSGIKEFKTQHPLPAVGGDVLLTQDFANFIHGGDITYVAAGYSVTANGRTAYNKATGNNPVEPAIGMNPAKWTAEFNVFDGGGVTPTYTRSVGMEGWGKDGNTSTRAGYIKIGGNKGIARLYTPELSSLEGNSTVKVTFKSAMYKESGTSYSSEILVQAVDNAVFDDQGRITNLDAIDIKDDKLISIENADGYFAEYEVTLENITPNTRIVFGSNPDRQSENRTRFLLDEIVITKLSDTPQNEYEDAVSLLNSTTSTLTVSWTFNQESELNNKYTIEIFKDKACTDLELSWNDIGGTNLFSEYLRYTFSGLESNKSYFIKVTDLTNNLLSGVKEFKTQHPLPAVGGDVLLTQDFANFIHGGDITYVAAGYSVTASGRTAYNKATGNNPVDPAIGMNPAKWTAEFNVFDGGGVTPAYTRSVGMEGWGKDGNTSTRAGYIKIGGNKGIARLYTPELSSLEGNSTVKVTFKSAMYKESGTSYSSEILVQAVDNAVFDDQGRITNLDAIDIKDDKLISIENADGFFAEYEVTLENVTPNTRIVFGSNPDRESENLTRFLLDEIVISKL